MTPLTEYNDAIQHLQRQRGIVSVAEQAKSHSKTLQVLPRPTNTAGSATTDPSLETPTRLNEKEFQDYNGMSVDENNKDEGPTEIGKILDGLVDGFEDSTLLRLSEEDVALDMDEVVMEVEEQMSESDDEDTESGLAGN